MLLTEKEPQNSLMGTSKTAGANQARKRKKKR